MHDYFDILGVTRNARPTEIRRACGRARASHPDIREGEPFTGGVRAGVSSLERRPPRDLFDAAVDFVDASTLVDAMRAAFFTN